MELNYFHQISIWHEIGINVYDFSYFRSVQLLVTSRQLSYFLLMIAPHGPYFYNIFFGRQCELTMSGRVSRGGATGGCGVQRTPTFAACTPQGVQRNSHSTSALGNSASAERSFSGLRRLESYMWLVIHLNTIALCHVYKHNFGQPNDVIYLKKESRCLMFGTV